MNDFTVHVLGRTCPVLSLHFLKRNVDLQKNQTVAIVIRIFTLQILPDFVSYLC